MTEHDDGSFVGGTPIEVREAQLAAGADALASHRRSLGSNRNALLIASGALITGGLALVLLGWFGSSRSTIVEEQVPYLISGGLLGGSLAILGGLVFFANWLAILVRETRAERVARVQDHAEMMEVLVSIRDALAQKGETNGTAASPRRGRQLRGAPSGR